LFTNISLFGFDKKSATLPKLTLNLRFFGSSEARKDFIHVATYDITILVSPGFSSWA
jgi:hypothetical protein